MGVLLKIFKIFLDKHFKMSYIIALGVYVPAIVSILYGKPLSPIKWNMTEHCSNPKYNFNKSGDSNVTLKIIGQALFSAAIMINITIFRLVSLKEALMKSFTHIYYFTVGFITLIIVWYMTAITIASPFPYYFKELDLYNYFCSNHALTEMTDELRYMDVSLRMSFPCYHMMVGGYTLVFSYLYWAHLKTQGLDNLERTMFIAMLNAAIADGIFMYYTHQHHLEDILAGFITGCLVGLVSFQEQFCEEEQQVTEIILEFSPAANTNGINENDVSVSRTVEFPSTLVETVKLVVPEVTIEPPAQNSCPEVPAKRLRKRTFTVRSETETFEDCGIMVEDTDDILLDLRRIFNGDLEEEEEDEMFEFAICPELTDTDAMPVRITKV